MLHMKAIQEFPLIQREAGCLCFTRISIMPSGTWICAAFQIIVLCLD